MRDEKNKNSMKNKKFFLKKTREYRKGFSLMEIIVTIGVLSIGLLSVMSLYADNLNRIFVIRSQATANALAQEGLELVRNYAEMTEEWGDPASGFPGGDYRVYVDGTLWPIGFPSSPRSIITLEATSDYRLNFGTGDSIGFTHETGTATRFARKIVVEVKNFDGETDAGGASIPNDRKVTSYVTWDGSEPNTANCDASNKCISAEMKLVRSK